jgi:hypothetical protein
MKQIRIVAAVVFPNSSFFILKKRGDRFIGTKKLIEPIRQQNLKKISGLTSNE